MMDGYKHMTEEQAASKALASRRMANGMDDTRLPTSAKGSRAMGKECQTDSILTGRNAPVNRDRAGRSGAP